MINYDCITHDLKFNVILFAWITVCKFMTGLRFLNLSLMPEIPCFIGKLDTNEVCSAFFAAPRDKFSICDHVKICR